MSTVKKNFIYNIAYHILIIFLPLITVPIVTRSLGATNLGIYSYTYSIANYFMLFGILGISNYGNREIAKNRDNPKKLQQTFWEIYGIQFIFSFLSCLIYLIYSLLFSDYTLVSMIQFLAVLSVLFDINWFFFGLEKFKITVTRNIFIKLLSFVFTILFVKEPNDLWIYTTILAFGTFLSQIILWKFLFQEIKFEKVRLKKCQRHLKGALILFIPVISYSVYKIMDKIMIGALSDVSNVAFYENAEKILNVPLMVITALGTVMLPRISNLISQNKKEETIKYINKSIEFIMFFILPVIFGLILIGKDFCDIYLGDGFSKSGEILQILSITTLFVSVANVVRTQYLIPNSMDKEYIISTIIGAIVNFILNIIFIPILGVTGACIGTIAAEFFVMAFQVFVVRKTLDLKMYFSYFIKFLTKTLMMTLCILLANSLIQTNDKLLKIIISVGVGVTSYGILNLKYIKGFVLDIFKKTNKNERK